MSLRRRKGTHAHALGMSAEDAACVALTREGWAVLGRRVRTEAGELDVLAEKDGVLTIVEVKARPTLADAAAALSPRQQARLLAAAEIVLAAHPTWGLNGVRFDLLVVDATGAVRRISDAFRVES
ncbi:MAG TPA: YraN family protein [Acetobacteraceae bacterium]|jgi:putative endonuclease|nr:YraN family protein [Acetobacteraceae bacterium]